MTKRKADKGYASSRTRQQVDAANAANAAQTQIEGARAMRNKRRRELRAAAKKNKSRTRPVLGRQLPVLVEESAQARSVDGLASILDAGQKASALPPHQAKLDSLVDMFLSAIDVTKAVNEPALYEPIELFTVRWTGWKQRMDSIGLVGQLLLWPGKDMLALIAGTYDRTAYAQTYLGRRTDEVPYYFVSLPSMNAAPYRIGDTFDIQSRSAMHRSSLAPEDFQHMTETEMRDMFKFGMRTLLEVMLEDRPEWLVSLSRTPKENITELQNRILKLREERDLRRALART